MADFSAFLNVAAFEYEANLGQSKAIEVNNFDEWKRNLNCKKIIY